MKRNLYERPDLDALPQVLSLGAGVQSSTLALMAAHGEVTPMPKVAIFADTQWEPAEVYRWLDWLEGQLPFPVVRVSKGDIRADNVSATDRGTVGRGERYARMPLFTSSPTGRGQVRRQCTSEYKVEPIEKHVRREVLGLKFRQRAPKTLSVVQWRGISMDEQQRLSYSREKWMEVRYPLVEQGMTRGHCLEWMAAHGYPTPPRSACLGCPYHSNEEWQAIKARPGEWADVVEFDNAIRKSGGMRGDMFLHFSLVPLDEANISTAESEGQMSLLDECEGMCGV